MEKKLSAKAILFIAGTLGQGGAEKQLFLLARSLFQNGHKVNVICLTSDEYWEFRLKEIGIKIYNISRKSSRFKKFLEIKKIVKYLKPDVVYSFHFYTSLYAGLLRFFIPNVLTIGSLRGNGVSEIIENGLWSWLHMHLCHKIISNNQFAIDQISKRLFISEKKLFLLNNAVELPKLENKEFMMDGYLKVAFVGRLVESKDPFFLLEILDRIKNYNFRLDIIGDGYLMGNLVKRVDDLNLGNKCFFLGLLDNVDMKLFNYDILISTSKHEGTPNAVLEALSAKCLIITRDFNGISELLKSVDPRYEELIFTEIDEAEEILLNILCNKFKCEYLIYNGLEFIKKHHSTSIQIMQFKQIIQ